MQLWPSKIRQSLWLTLGRISLEVTLSTAKLYHTSPEIKLCSTICVNLEFCFRVNTEKKLSFYQLLYFTKLCSFLQLVSVKQMVTPLGCCKCLIRSHTVLDKGCYLFWENEICLPILDFLLGILLVWNKSFVWTIVIFSEWKNLLLFRKRTKCADGTRCSFGHTKMLRFAIRWNKIAVLAIFLHSNSTVITQ